MKTTLYILFIIISSSLHLPIAQANDSSGALLQKGHKLSSEGDLKGAIEYYKKSLEADKDNQAAKLSLEGALREEDVRLFMKRFPKQCQNRTDDFEQNLKCAQNHFVVGGSPINPMIINDFDVWLSDSGNQVLSISLLESQHSNKYFCHDLRVSSEGFTISNTNKNENFSYTLKGKTDNGIFVISTAANYGGSGVFHHLLFIRIKEGRTLGKIEKDSLKLDHRMVVIEKLGAIGLGDRVSSEITIEGNTIYIQSEERLPPYGKRSQKITLDLKE